MRNLRAKCHIKYKADEVRVAFGINDFIVFEVNFCRDLIS